MLQLIIDGNEAKYSYSVGGFNSRLPIDKHSRESLIALLKKNINDLNRPNVNDYDDITKSIAVIGFIIHEYTKINPYFKPFHKLDYDNRVDIAKDMVLWPKEFMGIAIELNLKYFTNAETFKEEYEVCLENIVSVDTSEVCKYTKEDEGDGSNDEENINILIQIDLFMILDVYIKRQWEIVEAETNHFINISYKSVYFEMYM